MKYFFLSISLLMLTTSFKSNDKPAYILYDAEGNQVSYQTILDAAMNADIVFIGELHDNPIVHWLQYELTTDLYTGKNGNIILGAEMFESDNQLILDEYLTGIISKEKFEDEARLWKNYKTDYKPLIEFAKEKQIPFIATNIPRRYASVVFNKGFEGLDLLNSQAKKYIAPLPIEYDSTVPCYQAMLNMGGHGMPASMLENFPKSQAIKDATMAHFILKNHEKNKISIHYNGAFHSNNHEGIVWYIARQKPKLSVLVLSSATQTDISALEEGNKKTGDYIICVPESMTRTH